MRIAFALLFLLALPARADDSHEHHAHEGHLGQGHAAWHDAFYKKLLRPDTKTLAAI